MSARQVWLNGTIVSEHDAHISPFDRGFLLGDGVFETMRTYNGHLFELDGHLARLARSCKATRIPFPDGLAEAIRKTLVANGLDATDAAVRITVTRGPGGRGASPRGAGPSTVLVTATPVPHPAATYNVGLRLATVRRRRVPATALDPGIKSVNYLVHVLARMEAEDAGADEALFVDDEGIVVEASQANVFARFGNELVTPPLDAGCLPGRSRAIVLGLATSAGYVPAERTLTRESLDAADEIFLTASVLEVAPVVALDGVVVGDGKPGQAARVLHARYRMHAQGRDTNRNDDSEAKSG